MTSSHYRDDIPELHASTLRSSSLLLQKNFAGVFSVLRKATMSQISGSL